MQWRFNEEPIIFDTVNQLEQMHGIISTILGSNDVQTVGGLGDLNAWKVRI